VRQNPFTLYASRLYRHTISLPIHLVHPTEL
jgi:hypothetical protein